MVPGMTERERRAADMRRLEWLADAKVGPARVTWGPRRPAAVSASRPTLPIGLWRRGLASARINGQRLRLIRPGTDESLPVATAIAPQ
jgi:hypothetical protein